MKGEIQLSSSGPGPRSGLDWVVGGGVGGGLQRGLQRGIQRRLLTGYGWGLAVKLR